MVRVKGESDGTASTNAEGGTGSAGFSRVQQGIQPHVGQVEQVQL
jgi:hypothetical protein